MSERDSVHKEIEKLQDDVSNTNSKMKEVESKSKIHDEEKRKLVCQIEVGITSCIPLNIFLSSAFKTRNRRGPGGPRPNDQGGARLAGEAG
jgi:hypothetical protein